METIITEDINFCAGAVKAGEIVGFGTDTVYGVGADCFNEKAVKKVFVLKNRPADRPLNVLVSGIEQAKKVAGEWTGEAETLAKAFWPGALTLILPKSDAVPDVVTAGESTVGVRMPAQKIALEFLRACGTPLATPSANPTGKVSATKAEHVKRYFNGKLPCVLDTGSCAEGIESTVYDVEKRLILRVGSVSKNDIEKVLEQPVSVHISDSAAPHYKPGYKLILVIGKNIEEKIKEIRNSAGKNTREYVILNFDGNFEDKNERILNFHGDSKRFASDIYSVMLFYEGKIDRMFVCIADESSIGDAVFDRLKNAAEEIICC